MYIETSYPRNYGENAKLEFSVPSSDIGKLSCLKFYYHMYGQTVNTLNVYNGYAKIFTEAGNQGNRWLSAKITTTLQSKASSSYFTLWYLVGLECQLNHARAPGASHRKKSKLIHFIQFNFCQFFIKINICGKQLVGNNLNVITLNSILLSL